jgi:hypothetical protein
MIYSSGKKNKLDYPIKKLISKIPLTNNKINIPKYILGEKKYLAMTFINKFGQESNPIIIHLNQTK